MSCRIILIVGLIFCLTSCSDAAQSAKDEPIVYNYPKQQLPAEIPYGTTAWVQPPTVVPQNVDQSGFSEKSGAPLLKPAEGVPHAAAPKLPSAAQSRRY